MLPNGRIFRVKENSLKNAPYKTQHSKFPFLKNQLTTILFNSQYILATPHFVLALVYLFLPKKSWLVLVVVVQDNL